MIVIWSGWISMWRSSSGRTADAADHHPAGEGDMLLFGHDGAEPYGRSPAMSSSRHPSARIAEIASLRSQ